ncbi:MAG: NYN domain-containing protein [Bacillota bacterium]
MVIDGYNVINAWNDIFDLEKETLEDCRDKLLNILSNYQGYKKVEIIVVFDAHLVKGGQKKKENFDNLKIIYTKENQTADIYIERFVYEFARDNVIRVVTSDYLEQRIVLSSGGIRMAPRELKQDIEAARKSMKEEIPDNINRTNTIMSNIDSELLQKLEKIRRGR